MHAGYHSWCFQNHFEKSCFEREREDGRKKLKWNAVPTIATNHATEAKRRILGDMTNVMNVSGLQPISEGHGR